MDEIVLKELVQKMQKGDLSVFDRFYELTKKSVFYNIYALTKSHETSEDLLHDTYVKFLKEISSIDLSKSVKGFLMMMSRNLTLDYFKKHNRVELSDEDYEFKSYDSKTEIDENLLLKKIKKILKDKEFEIFVLHVLDDLTFEEISKLKSKPLGTILWSYNNAIKKIKLEVNV